ncbi:hypothetical protein TeGR_g11941, partial [Tetraparma gracilis]
MIVICLEGCHGCGKTQLTQQFESAGFKTLDEAFLTMPSAKIGPQSLLMETQWVCSWFLRLLNLVDDKQKEGDKATAGLDEVYVCDRSPFSAVCYSNRGGVSSGHLLEEVIREHIREVREAAGIEVYTVHVSVDPDKLWSRIQGRLQLYPERKLLKEDKREHMTKITDFYEGFKWDARVDNSEDDDGHGAAKMIMQKMAALSDKYKRVASMKAEKRDRSL